MKRIATTSGVSAALLAALLLSGAPGCRGGSRPATDKWVKAVNSIKPGTEMDPVRRKLGRPDEKRRGETPLRPYPPVGSPTGVLGTLAPETKYEQWIYKRGDSHYHVFFTQTAGDPAKWEVIAVRSAPADAVY